MRKLLSGALVVPCLLAACASPALPAARFHNAPPITTVDDRRDTPVPPTPRTFHRWLYHLRGNVIRPIKRAFEVVRARRALGINALDDVPDSTWFTNRLGARDVTPGELRASPGTTGSPEPHLPWTVHSTKVGGATIGFIIKDARGEKFILKFDKPGSPETETAAGVIAGRLLWGMGYNVPEDHVVYVRPGDLVLAPDAKIKDVSGLAQPLHHDELDRMLARVDAGRDGRLRGLASRVLDGTWLGGHPGEGTRPDDPNDRIAHELRRDLRGSFAMFAWLDHIDVKEDNSLDMLVSDPATPDRHYVKHYLIDFGSALGSMAGTAADPRVGHAYVVDFAAMLASFASAGLHERTWERRVYPQLPGVGLYDLDHYDPGSWKPNSASYLPFHTADRIDNFWGSKILIRYTRAQLHAAVESGRLSDPRSVEYLTDMLVARQRATARYWFARTAPLDRFDVVLTAGGNAVCFDDLMLTYDLAPVAPATRYTVTTYDRDGRALAAPVTMRPTATGRTCTPAIEFAGGGDGYTIARIATRRLDLDASTYVHLARRGGAVRVIGIWRQ
jgi:hypothetical protein